jgi:hypothetical protein
VLGGDVVLDRESGALTGCYGCRSVASHYVQSCHTWLEIAFVWSVVSAF